MTVAANLFMKENLSTMNMQINTCRKIIFHHVNKKSITMSILKTLSTTVALLCAITFTFSQELTIKKVGNKFGYENAKGKMVIKPVYDHAKEFSDEGWAEVNVGATESEILGLMGGNWGVIDESGKIIVPIEYDGVNYFANDKLFQAMKGNKAYFYNRKGKLVEVKDYTKLKESLFQD